MLETNALSAQGLFITTIPLRYGIRFASCMNTMVYHRHAAIVAIKARIYLGGSYRDTISSPIGHSNREVNVRQSHRSIDDCASP